MAISITHLSSFFEFNYQRIYLLSFLSFPLYDVIAVMIFRFNQNHDTFTNRIVSIVNPDQSHIHHIILKNNISKRKNLLILLMLFLLTSVISLIPIIYNRFYLVTFFIVLFIFVFTRIYFQHKLDD